MNLLKRGMGIMLRGYGRKLRLRNLGICQRLSNEVVKIAMKYNCIAIVYENLSNNFKKRNTRLQL
jgi:hypothetical protein